MSNNKIYNDLIDHLRNWIFGLPESKYLLPLFELRFTPEEAEFLSKIPFLPHTAEDLSDRLETPVVELTRRLDDLAQKGMIFRVEGRSAIRYSLPDSLFLFYRSIGWAGLDDEFNREISPLLNQYYIEAYATDYLGHPTQGLRTIPINETIQDTRKVLPYEDILKVIDHVEYYTVSTCPCSHRHNTDTDIENCKYDTLKCLHFDRLGRYIVQNGLGKEITKEETLEILKKAADAGLVHGISTTKERIDTICNCCTCCCLFLESAVKIPGIIPRGHQQSNYIREIDEEKCVACGICVTFCPMKALELNDKKVIFDPERCLGCGVCVYKCPQEACYLIHRDEEQDFPKDPREQSSRFLRERGHDPLEIFKKNS